MNDPSKYDGRHPEPSYQTDGEDDLTIAHMAGFERGRDEAKAEIESLSSKLSIEGEQPLLETLAAIEHDRWSHWQRYLHSKCEVLPDGSLMIPASLVDRWERQIATAYADLPEVEKQSDRNEVLQYFPLIESLCSQLAAERKSKECFELDKYAIAADLVDCRSQLAAEKERADRAEALARVHKNIAGTWKERFEKLLDTAGTYCGMRHSAGDSHEHTVKAYLELRDFLIKARNETVRRPQARGPIMTSRQQEMFDRAPRPHVWRAHIIDAGNAESGFGVGLFKCARCGWASGWTRIKTMTEGKRGVPCPNCNSKNSIEAQP